MLDFLRRLFSSKITVAEAKAISQQVIAIAACDLDKCESERRALAEENCKLLDANASLESDLASLKQGLDACEAELNKRTSELIAANERIDNAVATLRP